MAILVTNAVQVARFANALYGIKLGSTTNAAVNADIANIGLSATVNAYYDYSFGSKTSAEVAAIMLGNLGLTGNTAAAAYVEGQLNAAGSAKGVAVLNMLNAFSNLESDATFGAAATAWNATIVSAQAYTASNTADVAATATTTQTFTLTTGADTGAAFTGTTNNDTFNAAETTAVTWTVADKIDGGAGNDTFNVTQAAAITVPTGATVSNIETVNLTSGAAITVDASSGFSGLTTLNATSKSTAGSTTLTAAATTNVISTEADLKASGTSQLVINGGKDITVSAKGTTTQATALNATTGANAEISVGATSAAAGAVNVTSTFKGANNEVAGDIFVKGGTTVTVTQSTTNTTVNETNVQGAVGVLGNASTTAVTVNQDATKAASNTGTGVVGKTAGAVTVTDKNSASTTDAGTIATVTLNNAGAATINSGALTTLNLGGTLTTVDAGTLGALTTAANSTLALNLTGAVSSGTVTVDTDIKTLNISGNTTASTLATLDASGAQKINVSGDAKVTLTANTTGALTDVVVTNTAGASFGTALGAAVNFTGGAGADSIKLTANFTKAITMGDGDDTVTYAAQGTGGSVAAGNGTDTIIMTSAEADSAAGVTSSSTFNTKFTGFETLRVSNALAHTTDLDGVNGATKVILAAGANGGTINNLVSGGVVDVLADGTGNLAVGVKGALLGASDSLTLNLKNTSATNFRQITAANVETININVADAAAAPTPATDAVIHSLALVATTATSVVVAGNNGLTLTNTGNTKITNFDASGVVANNTVASAGYAATTDSAANLAVTFASANTTSTANVTIKGGAGDDVLSGTVAKDTISGNAGADYIYSDNAGTKEVQTLAFTYAAGASTVTINGISVAFTSATDAPTSEAAAATAINAKAELKGLVTASAASGDLVITSLTDGDLVAASTTFQAGGSATNTETTPGTAGTAAVDSLDGGAGADLLVSGGGGDTITGGAGADRIFFLKAQSNAATLSTITDYTYAVGGTSNDTLILGDVATAAGTVTTVQDLSAEASLTAALNKAALNNAVGNGLSVFVYGGDTYAYVETTGATGTYQAADFVVKLTGTPLAAGTAIAGTGFDAV